MNNKVVIYAFGFLILFFYSFQFFSYLYFILDTRDEIGYLSDSLLLLEGMRPSFSHSPSGLSTWFGSIFVLFNFIFNFFNELEFTIFNLFNVFDKTLFFHYQNLSYIKISLYLLNIFFLIYFFKENKNSSFFIIFLMTQLSPYLLDLSLSGKPYFLSQIFLAISLILRNKKNNNSIIFFALSVSERLENFVLLPFFIINNNQKIKKLINFILVFAAVSPWFTIAFIQNLKVLVTWILYNQEQGENNFQNFKYFFIIVYIFSLIFISFISQKKMLDFAIFFVLLIISVNYFTNYIPFRWTLPSLTLVLFYISNYIDVNFYNIKKYLLIILSFLSIFFLITYKNTSISDKEFTNNTNSNYIFEPMKIYETASFDLFLKHQEKITKITNIKNINYFKSDKAPLAFGESGNLERLFFRRYEFINRYQEIDNKNKQKFIIGESGLFLNKSEWCNLIYLNGLKPCQKN